VTELVDGDSDRLQVGRADIGASREAEIDQQKLAAEVDIGAPLAVVVSQRERATERLPPPHDDVHQFGGAALPLWWHGP